MKKMLLLLALFLPGLLLAQIPNPDFEDLKDGAAMYWFPLNNTSFFKLSHNAAEGLYSGMTVTKGTDGPGGFVCQEKDPAKFPEAPRGFPVNEIPPSITGMYSYDTQGAKCGQAVCKVSYVIYDDKGQMQTLAEGSAELPPEANFTAFMVPIELLPREEGDEVALESSVRVIISFESSGSCDASQAACCFLLVDRLAPGGTKPPHQRTDNRREGRGGRK